MSMRIKDYLYESSLEFRDVPGWPKYAVNTEGEVLNKITGKYVSPWKHTGKGSTYLRVTLRDKGRRLNARVHRLVAMAFIPNPDKHSDVDHIDGDTFNNNVENLEWVPSEENIQRMHSRIKRQKDPIRLVK